MKTKNKTWDIWNNDACTYDFDEVRAELAEQDNEWLDEGDDRVEPEDVEENRVWEEIHMRLSFWKDDEKRNLNMPLANNILMFIDAGYWNGRAQGYRLLDDNLNSIFDGMREAEQHLYYDRYEVMGTDIHHDGRHYYTFRVVAPGVDAEELLEKLEDGRVSESTAYKKYTRSLRPYIRKIYGC